MFLEGIEKQQKTLGFLMFSGSIEKQHWAVNGLRLPPLQDDIFSKCVICDTGSEFFYFAEKLSLVLKIFKF